MWPDIAHILWDGFTERTGTDTRRTPFEDGRIRQAVLYDRPQRIKSFSFIVRRSDRPVFDLWLESNYNAFFTLIQGEDPVRIVGGRSGVTFEGQSQRFRGDLVWRGQIEVESF